MKKIHRHPGPETSGPPISHAAVAPMPPSAPPRFPSALLRSGPSGKVVEMIERAVGVMTAAPTPWTTRAASSAAGDHATPQPSDAAVKSRDARHEQATAPQQVGRPPSEQQQAAVASARTRCEDPLQAVLREADVRT